MKLVLSLSLLCMVGHLTAQRPGSWDSKCQTMARANKTTATCFDPKDNMYDPSTKWYTTNPRKGFCYDKDGTAISYRGSHQTSCCTCFNYHCYEGRDTVGRYNYWRLSSISEKCCQDYRGLIYPPNEVMSTVTLDDSCATEKTFVCKYNRDWGRRWMGVIAVSYSAHKCCLDDDGLNPVNTIKLDPSTCSERTCRLGKPSVWSSCPVIPGAINCCVFNGTLIEDGVQVQTQPGLNATCCDGRLVVDYDFTIPKDCNETDAIHSSIGFAIDNTGSVSQSSVGVRALSHGLIDNLTEIGYIIPKWVLVTFNDHAVPSSSPPSEEDIAANTDLKIVTGDVDLFRDCLDNITFSGGGDGPERATQGLWVTLNHLPQHGIALVFTDHRSKDLDMEPALTDLRDKKNIKIFVVLAPKYSGTVGDASWLVYNRLSEGRIYNMANFNATQFLGEVVQVVGETCEGISLTEEVAGEEEAPVVLSY